MENLICAAIVLIIGLFINGCIAPVDEVLPYEELPQITLGSAVRLVASPSHPTSYLSSSAIPAGESINLIGADEDRAWVLVLHEETLGWMPVIFSRTNLATVTPRFVFQLPAVSCHSFLSAVSDFDEVWVSPVEGPVSVVGSLCCPYTSRDFGNATLRMAVEGGGAPTRSDYTHSALTSSQALVFFTYTLDGLDKGSSVSFELDSAGQEQVLLKAAFFEDECAADVGLLPVGALKRPGLSEDSPATPIPEVAIAQPAATASRTPVVISRQSGPPTLASDLAVVKCDGSNCDIYLYLRSPGQDTDLRLTDDPAYDGAVSWSPDGSRFAFVSDRSGVYAIYVFDMEKHRITRKLPKSEDGSYAPAWSPMGGEIAYYVQSDEGSELRVFDLESSTYRRLTMASVGDPRPHWSPNGMYLVFAAAYTDTKGDGRTDINDATYLYVINADGTKPSPLTNEPRYFDFNPIWMPDGIHILFSRRLKGNSFRENGPGEIYQLNLETGEMRALTFSSSDERWAAPSPTGDQILIFIYDKDEMKRSYFLANVDGELLSELSPLPDINQVAWRPLGAEN
jgi:Tol biopolymer transport system component